MNVADLPCAFATLRTMCLYHCVSSALLRSVLKRVAISPWPPVATSWWWTSISIPTAFIASAISQRMSLSVSNGAVGE